ncbi:TonB-dependent receptor [Aureibacter tunicatorum]|uniref:TonB-dependent receptor plug domain-containing protein n=1 Tax=Aureibacter tunicatorum TaxID=866807 RepID=A0AAE3XPM4_9BACT|nr:TonB-dependent receptor [Aureibacter tunicatorum]MDR6239798.1 hypothetical protein [Aureibacter tunicatorum]BDD04273.1 collagen-binding protein [Aureibacter tunicatorum]
MKTNFILLALLMLCFNNMLFSQNANITIKGNIIDASNQEPLLGVTIFIKELKNGTATDERGNYSLTLPKDMTFHLTYSFMGFESKEIEVTANKNQTLNISLDPSSQALNEVVITDEALTDNFESVQMSTIKIDIDKVKKLPSLLGEVDIIKNIQLQPGIINAGEGTSGFFVRGGSADQNMIYLDYAPVYDASHLFGLFSVFNADVISSSEIYKGGIPASYGGRLSSIVDIKTKEGNFETLTAEGGIGLLASRLMIEGPIIKDKLSFLVSGRRSYIDLFQRLSNDPAVNSNLLSYYDLNARLSYKLNKKNRLYLSGYFGKDKIQFNEGEVAFNWGNANAGIHWDHVFNPKLNSSMHLTYAQFGYLFDNKIDDNGFKWDSFNKEATYIYDLTWDANPSNKLNIGYSLSFKEYFPGEISPTGESTNFKNVELERLWAISNNIYVSNNQKINDWLSAQYGARLSIFTNTGSTTIYTYQDPTNNITPIRTGEEHYGQWKSIRTFVNIEPRIALRFLLNNENSIKASYNRMVQYEHLISNSTVPIPFNTWQPSSPYLDPQLADQIALGYFQNFKENTYEASIEVYYKTLESITGFADNADIFFNENLSTEFRQGEAKGYGLELYLKKNKGALTGAASYTLSKATRIIDGVNSSLEFLANYDRRHVFNLNAIYELNEKWTFGGIFTYSTGRPITVSTGKYDIFEYSPDLYSERNNYLLPDFHRLDISATLNPSKNKNRKWKSSWTFAIYNLYNRKNPFTITTRPAEDSDGNIKSDGSREAVMVYLFPILPSVTYNFKF